MLFFTLNSCLFKCHTSIRIQFFEFIRLVPEMPDCLKKCLMFPFLCLSDGVGCFSKFSTILLQSFKDEINWFVPPFSKQMEKMVEKCARLAKTKGLSFFAVEDYGNCYGAQDYSSGTEPKANRCNFGVGLENYFYVYKL